MRQRRLRTVFSALTCLLLPASAQNALAQNPPALLNIVTVDGEGAINNVGQRSAHDPSVRIEDENHKPISGAAVVFTLPTEGASGQFSNGSKTLTVVTDDRGIAAAHGLKVNLIPGKLPIHISASYRGQTARTDIMQFDMAVPGKTVQSSHKKIWIVVAVIAAAAGGGAAAAFHGGSSPAAAASSTPAIVITPGTGTVGPPH